MNKVAKNATWIIACKIVQSIIALIVNMLTARYLGPSNYGLITYASSLVAFVIPIMQLGYNNILVQDFVDNPEREGQTLGTTIVLCLLSSFFCVIGIFSFVKIANGGETLTLIVCLLYSTNLFFQACELIVYWFQAKLLSKYTSIISLISYLFVSIYSFFILVTEKSVIWFSVSNTINYSLIAIGSFIAYKRLKGQKLSISFSLGNKLFSRSKHYILSGIMVTLFAQTDKIMIKLMIGEAATGYYGAAVATAGLTGFVFSAIIDSFRPAIFEGKKINDNIFDHRLMLLYSVIIYVSLFQCVLMTVFAKPITLIFYGNQYVNAVKALQIVVWYTTFSYLGAVRNIWILANEKQHYLWKINFCGAVLNIILNYILIPSFGILGAASASLITQFCTNVVVGFVLSEIRDNNALMLKGANPRLLIEVLNNFKVKNEE